MQTRTIRLTSGADLDGFRAAIRHLVPAGVPPEAVTWVEGDAASLFAEDAPAEPGSALVLPRAVAELVPPVVMHRDPERYGLLHRLIWRVARGERHLAEVASDPLVHRLTLMRKAVARDLHKMHAFLRFRRSGAGEGGRERFAAWFEPEHHILAEAAPFFAARFPSFDWSILTPDGSAHW
ncbi:uracil-DNA glycosylase, partial [Methylobacterium frigidaeris]